VLHTVGLDLLILPVIMFIIEHVGERRWTPFFEVFGKNTLFIYLLSEVLVILMYWIPVESGSLYSWIYNNVFRLAGDYTGSFLFGAWVMLTCWFAGFILHRNKIYIKV
jgi:predicted acyltransferase